MKLIPLGYQIMVIGVAAAVLTACGESQSTPVVPRAVAVAKPDSTTSWMSPEAKSDKDLLYVSDYESDTVSVVKLPQGKLVGTLSGFDGPYGECSNSAGDVFVADIEAGQIWEFAHGAKSPKNILIENGSYPVGCSVDPKTGDLAVTSETAQSGSGNIAIFAKGSGKPQYYSDSQIEEFGFCAYDDAGNLYAGGAASADESLFVELPRGQNKLRALTFNGNVSSLSPMRWDGQYLAILDGDPGSLVYRFKIGGSTATEVGVLKLRGASEIGDFWIQSGILYAPLISKSEVAEYAYPRGGGITKPFFGFGEPIGTTISALP